jgi:GTP-binding protein HflX
MIEIQNDKPERAILVGVKTRDDEREIVREHIDELEELAATAGAETVIKMIQEKSALDSAFYIGKGKAEELAQLSELNEVNLVIFDDDLSPVQVRNLERLLNKKIVDRSGLILDIFAKRAKSKEAKTQVELAQMQYMMSRLTRAWTHLSKQYGGIGTKGPGETQIETDRRIIRERIKLLKEKLEKIDAQRTTQSQGRRDFVKASLVGYTNVGKSTIFNLFTEADVLAEDKLFATLDSTTRSFNLDKDNRILISDTVGFIRKLPANLVASFKSTLRQVTEADLILHVIDISHPYYEDQINVVEQTLKELNCHEKPQIKLFNKIDKINDQHTVDYILNKYKGSIIISALKGINISKLKESLTEFTENAFVEEEVKLTYKQSKFVSRIHDLAAVLSESYEDEYILVRYKCNKFNSDKIKKMIYG